MGEHRVSMLGLSLRRNGDPATSRDPRVQAVVRALKDADYAPAPRPEFRDELRAQLVAVTPRVVAEGDPVNAASNAASAGPARHRHQREARFPRPLAVAASVIALLALVLGGATWLSQKALPGDALYGLKRASENVRMDFISGNTAKGHAYLLRSQKRVHEAQELADRPAAFALGAGSTAGGRLSTGTSDLITSTLSSADGDLDSGESLLLDDTSDAVTTLVTGWAKGQRSRLSILVQTLPPGTARSDAERSRGLVGATLHQFQTRGGVPSSTPTVPVKQPSATRTRESTPAVAPKSKSRTTSGGGNGQPTSTPTPGGSRTPNAGPSAGPSGGSNTSPSAPVTRILPRPPNILTSPPISLPTCGAQVSLGSISAGVSTCATG